MPNNAACRQDWATAYKTVSDAEVKEMLQDNGRSPDESPVDQQLQRIASGGDHCMKLIGMLEQRLAPVLGPPVTGPAHDVGCARVEGERSPLAESLGRLADGVVRIHEHVAQLLARLEV